MKVRRILLVLVLLPAHVWGSCAYLTTSLVEIEVRYCRAAELNKDPRYKKYLEDEKSTISGIWIAGLVQSSDHVLGERPPHPSLMDASSQYQVGEWALFFTQDDIDCSKLEQNAWLTEQPMCCDTLPVNGRCRIQSLSMTHVEPRPERWYRYEGQINRVR